jgi:hypothetical protein
VSATHEELASVNKRCMGCGKVATLRVPLIGLRKWQGGALIQDALPTLSADLREQLISGTCTDCWAKLFPPTEVKP